MNKIKEDKIMFGNNGNDLVMPVAPLYGGGGNGGFGGGFLGGDGIWALLIFAMIFGGWGGGFGGFGGFGNGFGMGMVDGGWGLYPWLNNSEHISDGFRDQQLSTQVGNIQNAITSGFGDVQLGIAGVNQNICQTGNAVVGAVTGAQNALAQQLYTNQISDLERSFAAQTANTQATNALQSQLAQCCCDNRLATCQTQNIIQNEGNATRFADASNTRDILTAISGGIQSIKDQLCSDKIEQKNDVINQLRSELMYARGQASQDVQTAAIQLGQRNLANEVEQYVAPRAIPAYMVQNPNCCGSPCGCGNF